MAYGFASISLNPKSDYTTISISSFIACNPLIENGRINPHILGENINKVPDRNDDLKHKKSEKERHFQRGSLSDGQTRARRLNSEGRRVLCEDKDSSPPQDPLLY